MTDALAATMLQLTKDEAGCQPNAQECANFLWAVASLGHQPADKGLVDAVCKRFVRLIEHHDVSKRPNAQAAAHQLQKTVTRLGPRPLPDKRPAADLTTSKHLCATLEQLSLAFTANVPLSGHWADAVLQPQDGLAAPVVLVPETYYGHFSNQERRLTGRAVFRRTLLAKQGKLVPIPEGKLSAVADLADHVQQQVEDVTGDSLKPYIML
ncbi:TPA: hypothetical protein ACH3X2_000171 [Trebouxia sp. C0005]